MPVGVYKFMLFNKQNLFRVNFLLVSESLVKLAKKKILEVTVKIGKIVISDVFRNS